MKLNFRGPGKILELGWAVFMVELWNFKVTVNLGGYTLLYIYKGGNGEAGGGLPGFHRWEGWFASKPWESTIRLGIFWKSQT